MKANFLIILLIQCTLIYGQNETDLYYEVFTEYALKNIPQNSKQSSERTYFILKKPLYETKLSKQDFNRFKAKYNRLEESTFYNFLESLNEELSECMKIKNIDIILLDSIITNANSDLLLKYPHWDHYFYEISNIGFNNHKSQAIIYYGYSGLGIGGGIYLIFEKKKMKWKKVKVIPAWAT